MVLSACLIRVVLKIIVFIFSDSGPFPCQTQEKKVTLMQPRFAKEKISR